MAIEVSTTAATKHGFYLLQGVPLTKMKSQEVQDINFLLPGSLNQQRR